MPNITMISDKADAVLVDEEGDVLRAYRCPAGVLTIGTGLTAASGVVKPKIGMVITREESRRLRLLALSRNYAPRVVKALPTPHQHVFDGGVLFDWNTGAIATASWVKLFLAGAVQKAKPSFLSWNKAGGKVLPGLQNRRAREWNIIEFANYGDVRAPSSVTSFDDHRDDFEALGYSPYPDLGAAATVMAFQRDQRLTVDGVIGPATRAAIQRALAARASIRTISGSTVAGGAAGLGTDVAVNPAPPDAVDLDTLLWVAGGGIGLGLLVFGVTLAWRYRGPLFAWLPEPVKDFFEARGIVLGRRVRT